MLLLQTAHLVASHPGETELPVVHALAGEHGSREFLGGHALDRHAAAVRRLNDDHRRRAVPVSSAWRLYASTIRCTSLWRTTSSLPNSTNPMPSIPARIWRTWMSPDACSRGRSTCVTSPVTTIFEPN